MDRMVTLQLNEDELNLVVATVWSNLAGQSTARTTLERKLRAAFESRFGVSPEDINTTSHSGYVIADVVQRDLDQWRKRKAAKVEGATFIFIYHGVERVVKDATIDSKRRLLSGFELYRGGQASDQFKHYKLNEIG